MQKTLVVKLAVIAVISLLLMLPLLMISGKISEREQFLNQAKRDVSRSWTGQQTIMAAMLVIPYEVNQQISVWDQATNKKTIVTKKIAKQKFVLPHKVSISSKVDTAIRSKGIYKIPVYTSLLDINGILEPADIQQALAEIKQQNQDDNLHIGQAYLTATVSDPRGINSIPLLNWQGKQVPFKPGSKLPGNNNGLHAYLPDLLQTSSELVTEPASQGAIAPIGFAFELALRGMEVVSFIPLAQQVQIQLVSDWPHPQFFGDFLPVSRQIDNKGYQANWKVTSFASNIANKVQQCEQGNCEALYSSVFGIKHIEGVNVYLQSERSVKYGILFICLSFITFFIFEVVKKLPIHAIQYSLVGFAIAIFYLLLVSLSEHISFALSYFIAAFCCTSLLLFYLRYVLAGFKQALVFAALLSLLYGALYVIISAEDFALLMGACLTFLVLAIVMYSTRNINWYLVGDKIADNTHNTEPTTP
jgi:inner membrane protein